MKISDVMTQGVFSVTPQQQIGDAAKLMMQLNVSGLPVVNQAGKLVGIVTEGDFLRRTETGTEQRRPKWLEFLLSPLRLAEEYVHAHTQKVEEVMTREVVTIDEDAPLEEAVRLMEQHHIKRLPVLRNGVMIGIISRANFLPVLARLGALARLQEKITSSPTDQEIRQRITNELDAQPWASRNTLNIAVNDGIVEFSGSVFDECERQALRVIAENVDGVKEVRDRII